MRKLEKSELKRVYGAGNQGHHNGHHSDHHTGAHNHGNSKAVGSDPTHSTAHT